MIDTSTNTHARDRLEKLIEYIARGPLSNERLDITDDGKVKLQLKSPWWDGTSHLLLSPHEFLEKLVAIIPPPKSHLVRWRVCRAGEGEYSQRIRRFEKRSYSSQKKRKGSTFKMVKKSG